MKPVTVQLIGNALSAYQELTSTVKEEQAKGVKNSERQQLLCAINQKVELIKFNPQYGDAVPKTLVARTSYPVDNL